MNEEDLATSFKKELFEFNDTPESWCRGSVAVFAGAGMTGKGRHMSVIRVADTPSPALRSKFLKPSKNKSGKHRRPTPSKKMKKLLNPDVQLNGDDTLPGGRVSDVGLGTPGTQVVPMTQKTPGGMQDTTPRTQQTPSSLFKPKSRMNCNEEEEGCDLSYGKGYLFFKY